MKKALLFLAFLFCVSASFAQVTLGVYYFPSKTGILTNNYDPQYDSKNTFAGGAGLNVDFRLDRATTFQTGVFYASHNQKFTSELQFQPTDTARVLSGKRRLDYIKVPLFLRASHKLTKKTDFVVYGGPQLGYLIKGAGGNVIYTRREDDPNLTKFYDLPPSKNDYYNKFIIDAAIGAGLDVYLNQHFTFNTSAKFDFGITNTLNKKAKTNADVPVTTYDNYKQFYHNYTFALLLGVTYHFGNDHLLSPTMRGRR
ncbi:MAG: PorT family protein [Sporocytophaga sp.]|uniref:porin family protein n=1 Tax=Sporocytophaga sp. TaxID=2231183 RepID=UPI001B02DBDA|nr:porin family protein [Sporocytophaga sp.]MBO9699833.1 PorT family protein [Sporocytophaga sp.]